MGYDVRQPWGSANATLLASNYLDDFSKNRLEFDMEWNLRVVRGLEFEIGFSDLKVTGSQKVRDLWRQKDLGSFDGKYESLVPPHGAVLLKLSGQ